ncbi:MAG: efflux RND transporter periplasmic adaptor subunit [Candidatus Accumulibacter sp.]|uniref:efflux RND transporter periplasmic adaptor subunit n=1 Tax=Accumulibacter sp. TaxID=2053492 RepID=UPI001AC89E04|nr:efflux RND transporter periplasmic adaptor subunit [Accumulibacter sp.]MBK8116645.1 efflux RND transporter periplasmic adaptor subunit [Accumulibacter sp.]MBN8438182.1 efflux RND transporter periplasmic adaptor subunit [Accumulibacter sp.]
MDKSLLLLLITLAVGTTQAQTANIPPATTATTRATPARAASTDPDAIRIVLTPELETTLVAQMPGRIETIAATLGSHVSKGRPVLQMDCAEADARRKMADAELAAAVETLDTKRKLKEMDAAGDMELKLARATADKARGAVALARSQTAYCIVSAPFSGRVAKLYVKPYQGVSAGAPLMDLVSNGPLKLRLNIPSTYLRQIREGSPFEVAVLETGKTYPAKVTAINSRVDAVSQTVEIEGRLQGTPAELLPGMSGVARFPGTP